MITATYSPEDNKLRIYPTTRLDKETYEQAKALGFKWAPKQELFVAPMWTPAREDFCLELAGEIDDEDTSLVDRAESRAERFEEYSEKRLADANRAKATVAAISEHIPFGQPILVGHHSERHARKDAERIENNMRKAVNMWKTSTYWTARAAEAVRAAKYKERPDVRARRIKGLESDLRKCEKNLNDAEASLARWSKEGLTVEQAIAIANHCHWYLPLKDGDREGWTSGPSPYSALTGDALHIYAPRTLAEVINHAQANARSVIDYNQRWIEHIQNRLAYERAMLSDQIGSESHSTRFDFQPGGSVMVRRDGAVWYTILRVNKSSGVVNSLTLAGRRYVPRVGVEDVTDYRAPDAETVAKVKKATSLAPLCNYPGEGFAHMTKAEYDKISSDYKGGRVIHATDTSGRHRVRSAIGVFCKLEGISNDWNKRHSYHPVFLTDAPRKDPPAPDNEPTDRPRFDPVRVPVDERPQPVIVDKTDHSFDAMAQTLKAGIQTISAPQLFPTPPDIVRQMVQLADISPTHRVLEPSAGTGRILEALPNGCDIEAVEINHELANGLRQKFDFPVFTGDFLEYADEGDKFDRVVMNPPFERGADIQHIKHAVKMLKPGGRLVALCANGPRQSEALLPMASDWRDLPAGSFKESGTGVNVAMIVIDA